MDTTTTYFGRSRPGIVDRHGELLRHFGPSWYASVMGTAIVANAAYSLPVRVPGLHAFAVAIWALSAVLLLGVLAARLAHVTRHWEHARCQLLENPATAVFYGCPPMALTAVGFGTLTVGADVIGGAAAVRIDAALWATGTLYALVVAFGIPYLMMTRHSIAPGTADPTWLLPVVAPMVSAALGPALIAHLPAGQAQTAMLGACYAMFGAGLIATLSILPGIWTRLLHDKLPVPLVPTLFLVLGPLGQSVTAVNQLAGAAHLAAPHYAAAMTAFAVLYSLPVLGFAMSWLAIAAMATVRAVRGGLPFAMTWWAYTFPLCTCVTGTSALAGHLHLDAVNCLAVALYCALLVAWATTAIRTTRGVLTGALPAPAA